MASTLASVLVHIVFSTKGRVELLDPEIEGPLVRYIAGIGNDCRSPVKAAGVAFDHVHLLVSLGKTETLADVVMHIKKGSSRWIKEQGRRYEGFAWQEGYGGFSIGQSQVPALKRYFARQREHHSRKTFKDELRALLKKYEVEYDEQHVWG